MAGYLNTTQQNYYSGSSYGDYQHLTLDEIIDNFLATYVGEGKILQGTLASDVSFHAHRALAELHYDTLKSCKSQEIEVCPNLKMPLPQDYVNYVKLTSVDDNGMERTLYPNAKTSNPFAIEQTEGNCEDCGDSSSSYNYKQTKLKRQEIECATADVTCSFSTTGLDDASHTGANQIYQHIQANPGWSDTKKFDYWDIWFGLVDEYCNCLADSVAEENCGDYVGWSNFNLVNSGRTNPSVEMNGKAGWTGLQALQIHPNVSKAQAVNGTWNSFTTAVTLTADSSNTWDRYKNSGNTIVDTDQKDIILDYHMGQRYGLDPQHTNSNGTYFIDCLRGMIHFSSDLSGKTIILKYISDGLGTDNEMIVPKLAEEAIYKWILYGCLSAKMGVPAGLLQLAKREKFAETRKAKIRLSNIKIEEITQVLRGKSKHIKH